MAGISLKDTKYRKRIMNATDVASHPGHPRHHGIKMQAHHAISAEGVKRSGLGKQLVQFGYDINLLPNLVLIPSTLQGACHLAVQPHRGDHTAVIDDDASDDDDDHPTSYHKMVERRVLELKRLLTDKCPAEDPERRRIIKKKMDNISEEIVDDIQSVSGSARLTRIAEHFGPGSEVGCGGVDSVTVHSGKTCPVGRNHENRQGSGQRSEQISYKKANPYQLKVGR